MVELIDIRKRFGDLIALDGVTARFAPGRVHGLLGENGAGKSTLMNVCYGLLKPDTGQIRANGAALSPRSPRDAIAAGIGMVHQHFMLAGAMTVLDNVLLGDRRAGRVLDRRASAARLRELAERLGWPIDPAARIETLSVGQQQRIEILKALWRDVQLLILDEPTAVLTPPEVEQLFGAISRLRDEGRGIVFISHKLGEIRRICDELTVLRRGRVEWHGGATNVSPDELTRHMVGRSVEAISRPAPGAPRADASPAALTLDHVGANGLHDVSLGIDPGEILGIAGVDGNGQQELAEAVVGLRRIERGRITLGGADVSHLPPKARLALGVAHVPNDRKREALVPTMSVRENVALKRHDVAPLSRGGLLSPRAAARIARDLVARFDVRTPSIETPVGALSGGNQQKVVLARELAMSEPRLIVVMNPVRGLDVAATQFVYRQLLDRRAAGSAILLISTELDELLALCDRVGVLYGGRLTMTGFPTTGRDEIGRLMAGLDARGAA